MRSKFSSIILVVIFIIGLCLVLYPSVASYWNSRVQSRAIYDYEQLLKAMTQEDYSALFYEAEVYNKAIAKLPFPFMYYDQVPGYNDILDITKTGIIGYVSIEKIGVELPIYHGTSQEVLNVAAGHLQGSCFPIGGLGTHAVISAHRGLPSARLFTDLDRMQIGDTFTVTVLDRIITYEIDQIVIVTPDDVENLYVKGGEDHCTLVTCTPYAINTHRLLVRGARIDTITDKPAIYVPNEAYRIDPIIVTPAIAVPMLIVLLIYLMIKYRDKEEPAPDGEAPKPPEPEKPKKDKPKKDKSKKEEPKKEEPKEEKSKDKKPKKEKSEKKQKGKKNAGKFPRVESDTEGDQ